jgi:hypothetical protein
MTLLGENFANAVDDVKQETELHVGGFGGCICILSRVIDQ